MSGVYVCVCVCVQWVWTGHHNRGIGSRTVVPVGIGHTSHTGSHMAKGMKVTWYVGRTMERYYGISTLSLHPSPSSLAALRNYVCNRIEKHFIENTCPYITLYIVLHTALLNEGDTLNTLVFN